MQELGDGGEDVKTIINLLIFLNHVNVSPIQKFFLKNYIHHHLK